MREKSRGAGEAAEVVPEMAAPMKPPSHDNNSIVPPALQLSSSGMLSLRGRHDEEIVEQKLSEKLLEGFLLLEKACPCCATPLVKQEESADHLLGGPAAAAATPSHEADAKSQSDMSTRTLQATVTPIAGIPFCVTCQAHIVTNEVEAVALQERYAGKTVQGKIMVAVSSHSVGAPSTIPTCYSGRSMRSTKGKNATASSTHCASTVLTEMRDEASTYQSVQSQQRVQQQQQAQLSPALLTMKDTVEMFRSESGLFPKRSVPDKLTSPLSRPSISNMSSPHVSGGKLKGNTPTQKRGNHRLAPAFAIAHGGSDEIEIICAESTQWFSAEEDEDDEHVDDEMKEVETKGEEAGAEPEQREEELTMSDEPKHDEEEIAMSDEPEREEEEIATSGEDDDEASLRVVTSQDGPFETGTGDVQEQDQIKTEESSVHESKHSTSSRRSERSSKSDRSKQPDSSKSKRSLRSPIQKAAVNEKEPGRECDNAESKIGELDLGKEQQKDTDTSEKEADVQKASESSLVQTESQGQQDREIEVANDLPKADNHNDSNEEVTAEAAEAVTPDPVVDDHDDIREISVDHEDLMVGSGEDLTTDGSHLADNDQDHDDECWPSYEERKAVATKVLGVKIMQGYSLLEKQCPHCTMPLTEYKGSIDCFVCPVLEKNVTKAKQHRNILEKEMSRVKLETQMMEQRKTVQANKNKLLEKTKKSGKSSISSAKANSNASDKKIKDIRVAGQANVKPSTSSTKSDSKVSGENADSSHVVAHNMTSTENSRSYNNDVATSPTTNAGNLHIATSPSNITLKASNSSPAADGSNLKSAVDGIKATPTSQISIKTEASNQSKTIVKAVDTMSTSNSSGNASNQSTIVVKAQSVLTRMTAASSAPGNRSKAVVKATSLLSAATVASTQASNRSKVIRVDSLLSKSTMPCSPLTVLSSPASARSKTIVKANSLIGAPTAVSTVASDSPTSVKSSPVNAMNKTVVKASSSVGAPTAVSTKASDPPGASAKSKTVVKPHSAAGVTASVSTKASDLDQEVEGIDSVCINDVTGKVGDTNSQCVNDVTEKAGETETKSSEKVQETETKSSAESPLPLKSEDLSPTECLDSGVIQDSSEPKSQESGVSETSEKIAKVLSLQHSASTQLAGVTKNAAVAATKSLEGGSPQNSREKGARTSEGTISRPPSGKESRERGLPIRPVMALVKVTPQPAPAQRKRNKTAPTKTAMSTISTIPQPSSGQIEQIEQKLHSAPHASDDSSKFSSAHSDSTISTKSKISRSDRHVAVVEHGKEAEAEVKMQEKVNLAIGPTDIRSFNSYDSSVKNLSIATPADRGNCISSMFNAAIGTLSGEDDSIMPPTQHELHKMNLEEIRLLKEAIQAEKAMREQGVELNAEPKAETLIEETHSPSSVEATLIEATHSPSSVKPQENVEGDSKANSSERRESAEAKKEKVKSPTRRKESPKVSSKPLLEVNHVNPEDAQEVNAEGYGETSKREEVEKGTSTKQVENAKRKKETSVEKAREMTKDKKSPNSKSKKAKPPVQYLPAKIGALAMAIAEADRTAIAEAESIVRSFAEDYHDDQSRASYLEDIRRQQWETLRLEARAAMTRRSMTGWTVSSEFCRGRECASFPLVVKGSTKICVVCGGTGTGLDGVYDLSTEESERSKKKNHASSEPSSEAVIRPPRFDFNTSINLQVVQPPCSSPLNEATDTETESKKLIRPPRISGLIPPDSDSEEGIPVTKLVSVDLVKPRLRVPCDPTEVRMMTTAGQPDFAVVDGKDARDNIDSKRTIVSKEIGKRMLQGWKLLNLTCPTCLMPLMIDENDEHEICVLCGLVTEGIQSTGTVSTMQPTLSFKSTEDNDSSLISPISFTALGPINHSWVVQNVATRQSETIFDEVPTGSLTDSDSKQKPDDPLTETQHNESRKDSPRKSSMAKSSKESSRKSLKEESTRKSHKKSTHKSKKSTRKSSKAETIKEKTGDANDAGANVREEIGHVAEHIRHRANTPRGDPPAARGHNVARKSMLEADAMKAGDVVVRFDAKYENPVATENKACGPSPSTIKTFDRDPPKENVASMEVISPVAKHKACGPSPSKNKIYFYDEPQDITAKPERKPDAPSPQNRLGSSADTQHMETPLHSRSPSIDPESSVGEYNQQSQKQHIVINHGSLPLEALDQQDVMTLEIPKGFDVNDEAALRQLIANAKLCRPSASQDVRIFDGAQTEPGVVIHHLECLSIATQDEKWNCHLPSPGLTASPPGSLRVDIGTMEHHSEPTMEGSYHLPSPGMTEASLPLKSPASYRPPRSTAPELVVQTTRSQLRPRITPESMDRTRPSTRSLSSSRSRLSSIGEASSDYASFDYVGQMVSSHSQSRTSRIPVAPPGAYSVYRVERKTPQSPEIIVIGGPLLLQQSRELDTRAAGKSHQSVTSMSEFVSHGKGKGHQSVTSMDDLVSLGKSIAATSCAADSISTAALDALLARIEKTKFALDAAGDEEDGVEKQEKIAGLLQELSSAAAQMEMLDDPSSSSAMSTADDYFMAADTPASGRGTAASSNSNGAPRGRFRES